MWSKYEDSSLYDQHTKQLLMWTAYYSMIRGPCCYNFITCPCQSFLMMSEASITQNILWSGLHVFVITTIHTLTHVQRGRDSKLLLPWGETVQRMRSGRVDAPLENATSSFVDCEFNALLSSPETSAIVRGQQTSACAIILGFHSRLTALSPSLKGAIDDGSFDCEHLV